MKTSKSKIKSLMLMLFLSVTAISTASARVCFLPDSTDCGSSDVNIPDVPCQYYSCKEAGGESNAYQTCYPERTYNNGGVNVTCWQVKCNISKSDCEKQEADANNSQCCNFDSASGCYYMGGCKSLCNRDIYDSETDLSGEDYTCTSCKDKNGTFYNCTAKKECYQINSNYTSSCSDSQTAEEVKGVKDSKGNQCYTCKSKPIDKCVDIEATPFLDIIEPTVTTVKASGEVKEVNAKLECGINPKKAYKYEINIISNYDYIKLPVKRIKPVEYRYYASGSLPGYYYKTNIDGKNVCITDRLCTQYAKDGEYISAYEISIKDMSVKLDYKIYCCKTDDNFSGDSLSHLYSSCKEAQTVFKSQHIDRYIEPFYVCDKGIKEGTKCKIGSYSCPKDYELSGDNCVKKECPKGYVLTSDNGKDVCVNPTYTCPTDGKYKYKLSGNQCVCDTSKTCHDINPDYYPISDTEKYEACSDEDSDVYELKTLDVYGSDGQCFTCHHKTCTEIADGRGELRWFTQCQDDEVSELVEDYVGGDGPCYVCRGECSDMNSNWFSAEDNRSCSSDSEKQAVFYGKSGMCYECVNKKDFIQIFFATTPICEDSERILNFALNDPELGVDSSYWPEGTIAHWFADSTVYYSSNKNIPDTLPFTIKLDIKYRIPHRYRINSSLCGTCRMTFTTPNHKFGERTASIEIPQGTKLSDITEEKTISEAKGYVGRFISEHCTGTCLANYTNQTYNLIVSASYTISVDGNVVENRSLNLPAEGSGSIKTSFIYNNIKYVFVF